MPAAHGRCGFVGSVNITPNRHDMPTLQQAVAYLAKTVPKAERNHEKVLIAADHPTRSAEQNYPMGFASLATLQAIHRHRERFFYPLRKDHHWGKRKLKRDQ
jgi:hypothetical protein